VPRQENDLTLRQKVIEGRHLDLGDGIDAAGVSAKPD
jgi:hypothetical protein